MFHALRRLRALMVPLAWLVAIGCAAAVCAFLFWLWSSPPRSRMPIQFDTDPRAVAQRVAGQQPFAGETPVAPATPLAAGGTRFELVGLATGFVGGPGFALLRKAGATQAEPYLEGESLAPGLRLSRILADGVELERSGRSERLALPGASTPEGVQPSPSPQPVAGAAARQSQEPR